MLSREEHFNSNQEEYKEAFLLRVLLAPRFPLFHEERIWWMNDARLFLIITIQPIDTNTAGCQPLLFFFVPAFLVCGGMWLVIAVSTDTKEDPD